MKIGVFDSGVGGLSVANAIKKAFPENEVILREDKAHVPYGNRPPLEILGFVVPIFEELVATGCRVIVIACNTVSTTLIDELRQRFSVPLLAVEPLVKPAAEQTKTGVIAVCATPTTLASRRYKELKRTYASVVKVLEPDCSEWAVMIEHNQIDDQKIAQLTTYVLANNADIIVLACTHYHWIENRIKTLATNQAKILQPEETIIRQLNQELAQLA